MLQRTDRSVACTLCPRRCRLGPGERGVCGARRNAEGRVVPISPNRVCATAVDPIEKKPLYHVMPGSTVYSVACAGCTLRCRWCQNANISQQGADVVPSWELEPRALAAEMRQSGCAWVAYTYTEPFAWFEYTLACCQAVREAGGRNILVTAAYAEDEPVREVAPLVTAANVDVKSMSDSFYRELCGGSLAPVLRALARFRDAGVHLEVTNLVIPGRNDKVEEVAALAEWIRSELGPETPLHFSRFFPRHAMADAPPTPEETLRSARATALQVGLKHVYLGNVEVAGASDTLCARCSAVLVRRRGYEVLSQRVLPDGHCPDCAAPVKGVWA